LNLLDGHVREMIIQNIFHVARKFSIIRFDAAMTLTKRHYQRLWFPHPGTGGAIPSRAECGLTRQEFDEKIPNEFWREVVDRINSDMPETLLLAVAFWLMEGYFVRTLGMHRVYNSAFMHMLMKEENNKYRSLIKNTLDYNPEILKRYVNFMSNPDEHTAVAQFGKEDKYFGVALMMVTLPGLPMVAHGQVEGYSEKYGMEYKKAYYHEVPDDHLVRRHEQEIFPIMKKRYLFSQVDQFEFYDFHNSQGQVNENVFAYSNRSTDERALIVYHNKYEECRGWIHTSVPKARGRSSMTSGISLSDALNLSTHQNVFSIFKDHKENLEYVRPNKELKEKGLFLDLKAFQYHVFLDFREVEDYSGEYSRLAVQLEGKGVASIQEALISLRLHPLRQKLYIVLTGDCSQAFEQMCFTKTGLSEEMPAKIALLTRDYGDLLGTLYGDRYHGTIKENIAALILNVVPPFIEMVVKVNTRIASFRKKQTSDSPKKLRIFGPLVQKETVIVLQTWLIDTLLSECLRLHPLGVINRNDVQDYGHFEEIVRNAIINAHPRKNQSEYYSRLCEVLQHAEIVIQNMRSESFVSSVEQLVSQDVVRNCIGVNWHNGTWYFHQERFEEMIEWITMLSFHYDTLRQKIQIQSDSILEIYLQQLRWLKTIAEESGFDIDSFREMMQNGNVSMTSAGKKGIN
jgi:hypothetical protein